MHKLCCKINQLILCVFLLSLAACKCAPNLKPKITESTPTDFSHHDFSNAFTWSQKFDETTQQLSVNVHLSEGFHAYAAGEKIGVPVDLEISAFNGWHMEGKPSLPAGVLKQIGAIKATQALENEFVLAAKVTGGKGALRGTLKMQLCSASACDRPREHHFEYKTSRGN